MTINRGSTSTPDLNVLDSYYYHGMGGGGSSFATAFCYSLYEGVEEGTSLYFKVEVTYSANNQSNTTSRTFNVAIIGLY